MLIFEIFVGNCDYDRHQVDNFFDSSFLGLEHFISSIFRKIADSNFKLEDSGFKLLYFFLDILWIKVSNVAFEPGFFIFNKFIDIVP